MRWKGGLRLLSTCEDAVQPEDWVDVSPPPDGRRRRKDPFSFTVVGERNTQL